MDINIETKKLAGVLRTLASDVGGACARSEVCIGTIGGMQVHLLVTADETEFMDEVERVRAHPLFGSVIWPLIDGHRREQERRHWG